MATLLRRNWGSVKPVVGSDIDPAHPLAQGLVICLPLNEMGGRARELVRGARPITPGSVNTWRPTPVGGGLSSETNATYYWTIGTEGTDLRLPLSSCTVVLRQRVITGVNGSAFGSVGSGADRLQAHLPYGDTAYWDFGGASSGTTRISVRPADYGSDVTGDHSWAFLAGTRGMSIWQNGIVRASQTGATTRSAASGAFYLNSAFGPGNGDARIISYFYLWARELEAEEIAWVTEEPYVFLTPPGPKILYFDLGLVRQFSHPSADASAGSWTTAPLYSKVNETPASDSNFITSETLSVAGNTSNADLTLAVLTDPVSSVNHILRVRAQDTLTLGATASLKAELRQGATLIATLTASLSTSYGLYEYTLSGGEADAITDYTALFVRLYGVFGIGNLGGVQVSWVEFEVPAAAVSSTPVSDADTGSSTEAGTITAAVADADTGTGAEAGETVAAAISDAETGTAVDAAAQIAFSDADTGTGVDAGETVAVGATDTETATATDAGEAVAATLTDAETGSATDGGESIAVTVADAETGTGADAGESVALTTSDADTGTGTDAGEAVAIGTTDTETGSSTDTESALTAGLTDTEPATATDAGEALAGTLTDDDTGTAVDAGETIVLFVFDSDSGSATDGEDSLDLGVTDTDTATATDASEAVAVSFTDDDLATFFESESIAAALTAQDEGTATDDGTVEITYPPAVRGCIHIGAASAGAVTLTDAAAAFIALSAANSGGIVLAVEDC